jgi:tetratricopeptide (TPR) repeat protein
MAKYQTDGDEEENFRLAGEAFTRALDIDPELSLAHNLYTFLEVEEMGRAKEAMVRLLERASARPSDADLYAGLVLACRFCGLLEPSVEADRTARRIDPGIQTSVQYTYWLKGDFERAMAYDTDDMRWTFTYALFMVGREAECVERYLKLEESGLPGLGKHVARTPRSAIEGNREECVRSARILLDSRFHDPEGLYFMGRSVAKVGDLELALEMLERVVSSGFSCPWTMRNDSWLDGIRSDPRFLQLVDQAESQHQEARQAFIAAGGERLLGLSV